MKRLLLLLLFFFSLANCNAVSNFIHLRKETIYIKTDLSDFQSVIEYQGITCADEESINIISTPLQKLSDYKIGKLNGENIFKYKKSNHFQNISINSNTFYDGLKIYSHTIDKNSKFIFTYKMSCKESMLFSNLAFFDINDVDTFEYFVHIPKGINYKFDFVNSVFFKYCKSDSTLSKNETIYHIIGVYNNREIGIIKRMILKKRPLVRLILTPENYIEKESKYFNKWYLELTKKQSVLNDKTIIQINEITKNSSNKDSILLSLFRFTQNNIKYLDIEDGINAYRPQDVNLVMDERQGDCKGKANLLCQSLIYKNIDARIALVGTTTNICDFDFPSIVSANHVICAVLYNNQWLFLDPTDPGCLFGNPSNAIQGRTVFITGIEGGMYVNVNPIDTFANKTIIDISLNYDKNKLTGEFSYVFKGQDSYFIKNALENTDKLYFNNYIELFLSKISPNITYLNKQIDIINDTVIISGIIEVNDKSFIKTTDKYYLNLNFIPDLLPEPIKLQKDEYLIESASNIFFNINVNFSNPFILIGKPEIFTITDNNYTISNQFSENENGINLNFHFLNSNTLLDNEIIQSYNEIYNIIQKKIKTVLCFTY